MKVYISATLRTFFGKKAVFDISENSVRGILEYLTDEYPESKKILFDESGKLRDFIRVYAGEDDKTDESVWDENIESKGKVLLLPAIAGGAPEEDAVPSIISDERRKEVLFDDQEVERFGKHLMLRDIGVKGQKRIKASKVVIFGAGALGSPVIQYLVAAGVGIIKVVDASEVSLDNLQSQVIHTQRDLKRPKVASAKDKVRNINRSIVFEAVNEIPDENNILDLIEGYDLVIDCSDNYKARYLINDACAFASVPLVFGAVYQFEGQVGIFNLDGGPCYRCQFPAPPPAGMVPTCAEGGAISPLPGIIGSIMANEALKLIIGIGEHLNGKLLTVDSLYLQSNILKVKKNDRCPICGKHPTITAIKEFDYDGFCGLREVEEETPIEGITPEELAERIEKNDAMTIIDVREPHERTINRFENAIAIPIGQLARRQKELNPEIDTIFICKEGKRSILAVNTLREAGYKGPMYNLKGGMDAMKDILFSHDGAWL